MNCYFCSQPAYYSYLEIWNQIASIISDDDGTNQHPRKLTERDLILPEVISFFAFLERILLEPVRAAAQGSEATGHLEGLQCSVIIFLLI